MAYNISYNIDQDGWFCKFCQKQCKNQNSLAQHQVRCKQNPNRITSNFLTEYVRQNVKGRTAADCPSIAKQSKTMKERYANGYVSPIKGVKRNFNYIYEEHNQEEFQKWIEYVNTLHLNLPTYAVSDQHNEGYVFLKPFVEGCRFEHQLVAKYLLELPDITRYTVHHIDHNRKNNKPTNLAVFVSNGAHKRYHNSPYAYLIYDQSTHTFDCILKHPS